MPQVLGIDPNSILRILTNTDDPNRRFPGPQNADQLKSRESYAYDLMKNMQLQGNANYVPMNALADSIRGYMGGRYLDKNNRAVRDFGERDARAMTRGTFPNWGGTASVPTLREPVMPEERGPTTGSIGPSTPQQQGAVGGGFDLDAAVKKAANNVGMDPALLRTFVDIESGGNPKARTGKYVGLLQLSEDEKKKFGKMGLDLTDPEVNLTIGAAKLKAQSDNFKAKYNRDPSPEDLYMIHQQGEGGYDMHTKNPDAPAWQNMANTAEGRARGSRWAKEAIWRNVPDDMKKQFGSVDNVTSGQFLQMWGGRVKDRMSRYATPNVDLAPKPMNFNQDQTLQENNMFPDPARMPGRASLQFNPEQTLKPDNMFAGGSPLLDTPAAQIGQKVSQAGSNIPQSQDILPGPRDEPTIPAIGAPGQSEIPKNIMPQPPANQTTIPKNVLPIPRPPEGTIPINAEAPNTQNQFAGTSQTRPPEMSMADAGQDMGAEGGGDSANSGQGLLELPTSPYSQMNPNQLYDILKSPTIDPQMKMHFMQRAQEQGQMQKVPVEGGSLYYNPRTGKQLYVPEPKWGTTSIGGISVPSLSIKRKVDGPWESFLMDGTPVPSGGGADGGQDSGGGPSQAGIEGLAARGRNIKRQDELTQNQTKLQSEERKKHAEAGELAEKNAVALQRLRQLENAPDINNLTTGMTAPAWNEFKKTINTWLPGTIASEGPISLHDIYSSIATNAAASLARASDPNPSVKQFEAMLSTNPGFAQTPAGRKALLLSLEHTVNLERDIGKIAKSSEAMTSPDEYNRRVEEVRNRYAKKKIIPDLFLNPKFIKSREFKNMKWLSEGENPDEKVKIGEYFVNSEGKVMKRKE